MGKNDREGEDGHEWHEWHQECLFGGGFLPFERPRGQCLMTKRLSKQRRRSCGNHCEERRRKKLRLRQKRYSVMGKKQELGCPQKSSEAKVKWADHDVIKVLIRVAK